jgi:hypothetical protein
LVLYVKGPFSLLSLQIIFKADGSELYSEPTLLERDIQYRHRCQLTPPVVTFRTSREEYMYRN